MSDDGVRMGSVVRMVGDRGFGFLRDDRTGKEYFFHKTAVLPTRDQFDSLRVGSVVRFELDPESEKPRAATVEAMYKFS